MLESTSNSNVLTTFLFFWTILTGRCGNFVASVQPRSWQPWTDHPSDIPLCDRFIWVGYGPEVVYKSFASSEILLRGCDLKPHFWFSYLEFCKRCTYYLVLGLAQFLGSTLRKPVWDGTEPTSYSPIFNWYQSSVGSDHYLNKEQKQIITDFSVKTPSVLRLWS